MNVIAGVSKAPVLEPEALLRKHQTGYRMFFWIAGLSLVNAAIIVAGSTRSFMAGLGITQIIDVIALRTINDQGEGSRFSVMAIALFLNVLAALVFVLLGYIARRNRRWPFIAGTLVYTLDGLIFLIPQDSLSIGFHILMLLVIFRGYIAGRELVKIRAAQYKGKSLREMAVPPKKPEDMLPKM